MPYAPKLYLYLGVGFVITTVLADQWLRHLSSPVFGFGAAHAAIVTAVDRLLFGRKTL